MPNNTHEFRLRTFELLSTLVISSFVIAHVAMGQNDATPSSNHWSFRPIVRPTVPLVEATQDTRHSIDAFVIARLEKEGLTLSPQASREALIRRLSLDLLGLPPTPEAVDRFVADFRPGAYERLVDRLLASPRYGECWGRHWLDVARYADSDGYNYDAARSVWKYRDWVIDAFNADMPFDEFTIEQIAGDLLDGATVSQKTATGFHRNTLYNREGGNDPEQYRVERVVDRVNTTGAVFLGLTVGCAECHSHKYDPISQREYYELFAFFNNSDEPSIEVPTLAQTQTAQKLRLRIEELEEQLKIHDASTDDAFNTWEERIGKLAVDWTTLVPSTATATGGSTIRILDDHSVLVGGVNPPQDTYTIVAETNIEDVTGFRLEVLTHDSLPKKGPGRAENGNFLLSELRVEVAPLADPSDVRPVTLKAAAADHSKPNYDVTAAIDGDFETGWALNTTEGNVSRTAVFETDENINLPGGALVTFHLSHLTGEKYGIGRCRLSLVRSCRPVASGVASPALASIVAISREQRTDEQRKALLTEFRKTDAERNAILAEIAHLKKMIPSPATTLVVAERTEAPRETHIHDRGNYLEKGELVQPTVPAVLPPLHETRREDGERRRQGEGESQPTRLDLAWWLVSRQNPLTARVTVNRVWQRYFGTGIVRTENDFGTQGAPPTHPLLLDWLADEFERNGWSMKQLHRIIVTSATYRQSCQLRPELARVDPDNLLVARQHRLRLSADQIRDAALAVGGLLSGKIGGPSVFPYQVPGVMKVRRTPSDWVMSSGEDRYRRGIYIHFWRTSPHPFLTTFDAPLSDVTCTRRSRSNTPLQALMLLNDVWFLDAASALAERILAESSSSEIERIRSGFRLCLGRWPSQEEQQHLAIYLASQLSEFASEPEAARELVGDRETNGQTAMEVAAWTSLARVLMNLDEFVTRE